MLDATEQPHNLAPVLIMPLLVHKLHVRFIQTRRSLQRIHPHLETNDTKRLQIRSAYLHRLLLFVLRMEIQQRQLLQPRRTNPQLLHIATVLENQALQIRTPRDQIRDHLVVQVYLIQVQRLDGLERQASRETERQNQLATREFQNPNAAVFDGIEVEREVTFVVAVAAVGLVEELVVSVDEEVGVDFGDAVIDGVVDPGVDLGGVEVVTEVELEAEVEEGGGGGAAEEEEVDEIGEAAAGIGGGGGVGEEGVVEVEGGERGEEGLPFAADGGGAEGVEGGQEGEDVEEEVVGEVVQAALAGWFRRH